MLPRNPVTTAGMMLSPLVFPSWMLLGYLELPGDLETRDETTAPPSSPGLLEHVLLTRDSPEDLNTKLVPFNDPVFGLGYLPYYRTSHVFISLPSLTASCIGTETEEIFNEGKVNTKQDEKVNDSVISTGYFPYYRTYEMLLGQPLTYGLNADNDGEDESKGDVETITPPSVESPKRTLSSMTDEEPPALQLLRVNTSEHCLSTISFPSGLTGLNQPFSSEGYFPYYRTERELCIDPALGDRIFTRREGLENKEGGQEEEPGIWSLSGSCLVC